LREINLSNSPNQFGTIEFPINTIEFPINRIRSLGWVLQISQRPIGTVQEVYTAALRRIVANEPALSLGEESSDTGAMLKTDLLES